MTCTCTHMCMHMCMHMYVSQAGHRCVPVEGQRTSCLGNTFFLERARAPGETTRKAAAVFLQRATRAKAEKGKSSRETRPKAAHASFAWKRARAPGDPRTHLSFPDFYGLLFTCGVPTVSMPSRVFGKAGTRGHPGPCFRLRRRAGLFSSRAPRLRRCLPRRTQNRRDRERREATKARGQGREK